MHAKSFFSNINLFKHHEDVSVYVFFQSLWFIRLKKMVLSDAPVMALWVIERNVKY